MRGSICKAQPYLFILYISCVSYVSNGLCQFRTEADRSRVVSTFVLCFFFIYIYFLFNS